MSSSLLSGNKSGYSSISSKEDDVEQGRVSSAASNGHSHGHPALQPTFLAASHPPERVKLSPRSAYQLGDVEASKAAHAARRPNGTLSPSAGGHSEQGHKTDTGEYIKSIVYGGLDGIITTFATVTSVAGAEFSAAVIVVLGISHLFADGLAMGMGDYMSSHAEEEYTAAERAREQWEMDNNMSGEIEEMIDIYREKGISEEDARTIINTLAKYPDKFLDHMMVEELGLLPPAADQGFSPAKAGMVTMASFMAFGAVPLVPYLLALIPGINLSATAQLIWAVVMTLLTLFMLGAFKGKMVEVGRSAWWRSGAFMAFNGSVAAFIGYLCGYIMGQVMELPPGAG